MSLAGLGMKGYAGIVGSGCIVGNEGIYPPSSPKRENVQFPTRFIYI